MSILPQGHKSLRFQATPIQSSVGFQKGYRLGGYTDLSLGWLCCLLFGSHSLACPGQLLPLSRGAFEAESNQELHISRTPGDPIPIPLGLGPFQHPYRAWGCPSGPALLFCCTQTAWLGRASRRRGVGGGVRNRLRKSLELAQSWKPASSSSLASLFQSSSDTELQKAGMEQPRA